MTGGERCGDAVSAVANDEAATVACEAHRRCLAALLEQLSVSLHRRRVDGASAARADANLIERNVDRRRTAVLRAHFPSFLWVISDGQCGRMESNHHSAKAAALQAVELADAQRPHEG